MRQMCAVPTLFQNLCRLCGAHITELNHAKNSVNIFEKPGLKDKIRKYLLREVNKNDSLPQRICVKCLKVLNGAGELTKKLEMRIAAERALNAAEPVPKPMLQTFDYKELQTESAVEQIVAADTLSTTSHEISAKRRFKIPRDRNKSDSATNTKNTQTKKYKKFPKAQKLALRKRRDRRKKVVTPRSTSLLLNPKNVLDKTMDMSMFLLTGLSLVRNQRMLKIFNSAKCMQDAYYVQHDDDDKEIDDAKALKMKARLNPYKLELQVIQAISIVDQIVDNACQFEMNRKN